MNKVETKHARTFRETKLKPGETVIVHLEGWIGDVMGKGDKTQRHGQLVITEERVCFYRKGFLGEVLETIPLSKITSIETRSMMGFKVLKLHTSHDSLEFKTFEAKPLVDEVHDKIEELRHGPAPAPAAPVAAEAPAGDSIPAQIRKLASLRDEAIITQEEFEAKKSELLARM